MPKEMPESSARSRVCNVLVIGAGAAGLRAAIAATQAGSQVLVVGKRDRLDAHTVLAAGGMVGAGLLAWRLERGCLNRAAASGSTGTQGPIVTALSLCRCAPRGRTRCRDR